MSAPNRCTVPAAKTALRDLLKARTALADVLVQLHIPVKVPQYDDRIYIVNAENLTSDFATQEGALLEQYNLVLLVESRRVGATDPEVSAGAMWAMIAELDAQLVEDPELGGAIRDSHRSALPAESTLPLTEKNGWLSRATVHVHVDAVI